MAFRCAKSGCNNVFVKGQFFIWKNTKRRDVKICVCQSCYEKRQKWLEQRGLK